MGQIGKAVPSTATAREFQRIFAGCALLILTAGFEERARRLQTMLKRVRLGRVLLVHYPPGIEGNDDALRDMQSDLESRADECVTVLLDARRPDNFIADVKRALARWRPDISGEIWLDVTPLPMQGICSALAAIRESLPNVPLRVIYTEAGEYNPTRREVVAHELDDETVEAASPPALSTEMSGNLIPKHFAGASSEVGTCLFLFAGYEKHRSLGVVDELNPSKLVLIYGRPERDELQWRLKWSRRLHSSLPATRPTSVETVSTLNPWESLTILSRYYGYLFSDHNVAVAPVCSKMQCVAAYLFWERHRDAQLVFPLPVTYLPHNFSKGHRDTFHFLLPDARSATPLFAMPT